MRNWVEIDDDVHGTYKTNTYIKYKTTMLDTSLCNCSDAYILIKITFTVFSESVSTASRQMKEISKQYLKIAHQLLIP